MDYNKRLSSAGHTQNSISALQGACTALKMVQYLYFYDVDYELAYTEGYNVGNDGQNKSGCYAIREHP